MRLTLGVGVLFSAALALSAVAAARADEPAARELTRMEKQIQANLRNDSDLADNHIDVRVSSDGVATLKGTVDSEVERRGAVRLAGVAGVRVVDDQLDVEGAGTKAAVPDGAITSAIKVQLLSNAELRQANISVAAKDGVVTLTGTVPSVEQRRLAVDLARHTGGVVRVDDQTRLIGNTPADPEVPVR